MITRILLALLWLCPGAWEMFWRNAAADTNAHSLQSALAREVVSRVQALGEALDDPEPRVPQSPYANPPPLEWPVT